MFFPYLYPNILEMTKAKIKIILGREGTDDMCLKVNSFLDTLDVRQIIKITHNYSCDTRHNYHTCMIVYINFEDIRDLKLDSILDNGV